MKTRVSDSAAPLPTERAKVVIPDVATALLLGARHMDKYCDGDGVFVSFPQTYDKAMSWHLARHDFEVAMEIAGRLEKDLFVGRIVDGTEVLRIRRHAERFARKVLNQDKGKSVAMLKDKGSSGWWRMVVPVRMMEVDGWDFDCTAAQVEYDSLLEYDTIFVQRIHDWESFYMLERLKRVGKRIVYDIDDDLFNITPDNPAYNTITRDDQLAAAHAMRLADVVTTTTSELQRRLTGILDGVSPVVVPNAWDCDDGWSEEIGSPDGVKRIIWSGGASHGADWEECFDAVRQVMRSRGDVRLMILGYLPSCVERSVNEPEFKGRIEFCGFRSPQTYYEMIHHVRADVGLAPLRETDFNAAKSPIKYLEYSLMGVPTVASDWLPYSPVIEDKVNGRLVPNDRHEWMRAIEFLLDRPNKAKEMVKKARERCAHEFNLRRIVKMWEEILCRN